MKTACTIIILLLAVTLAGAETYRWTGDDGSVTFRDTPPPAGKKRKKVTVYDDSMPATAPSQTVPAPPVESRSTGNTPRPAASPAKRFTGTVEIYVTNWCGYCKQALNYLQSNNIPYVAYDIEKDRAAEQRHKDLGGRGVPLIIVGDHKLNGFSRERLEQLLNKGN